MSHPLFLFAAAGAVLLALAFVIPPLMGGRQKATLLGALVFVPAVTLAVYFLVGTPAGIDPDTGQTGEIRSAVTDLARRAVREPGIAEHWTRLGLAYKSLEEFSSAEHAFRRALYIDKDAGFLKAELGETLLYASGERQLPEEARRLLEQAAEDGNHKALWLLGLDAFQAGEFPAAADRFERLLAVLPPDSNVRNTVEQYLVTARGHRPEADATDEPRSQVRPTLSLSISIDERLAQGLEGHETVFVAVRSAAGGPPLAVRRLQANELPVELTIDDDDAMIAGNGLSSADAVVVVARVSFSGDATPAKGDLEGRTDILAVGNQNIETEITIDQVR